MHLNVAPFNNVHIERQNVQFHDFAVCQHLIVHL